MSGERNPYAPWEYNFRLEMKRLRELQGLTQTQLARMVKDRNLPFHQQTIQRIEKGERPVRLDEAYVIAECLDVDLQTMTTTESPDLRELRYDVDMLRRRAYNTFLEFSGWDPDLEEASEGVALNLQNRLEALGGVADSATASLLRVEQDARGSDIDDLVMESPAVTEFRWVSDRDAPAWRELGADENPVDLAELSPDELYKRGAGVDDGIDL